MSVKPFAVTQICAPDNDWAGFAHVGPDCRDGKHKACRGEAWCFVEDAADSCDCPCHAEDESGVEVGPDDVRDGR